MVFRYKVNLCLEEDDVPEIGLIFADSYACAADKIENTYGEDLISIDKLKQITEGNLVTFPTDKEDVIDKIENDYIW